MIAFLSIIFLLIPCLVLADNTTLFSIDDRDPSIKYSDGWNFTSAENEHNGTGMLTTIAGSYATFTFTGACIYTTSILLFFTPVHFSPP